MRPEALSYLTTQRTCVIAVEMPDGSPHAATLHFAHTQDPLQFIFLTERGYKKAEPLLRKDTIRASVVVGTQEGEMKTLQLDGTATLTEDPAPIRAYYAKFTDKNQDNLDEDDIFFIFKPIWWRFTDWTPPEGKTTFDSDGKIVVAGKS
jgi:general stress protein 26